MLLKKNISHLNTSATLAINEKSKQLIAAGKKIVKFGFGQSPFPIPKTIVNTLKDNASRKEYAPVQGLLDLRKSIATDLNKKLKLNFDSEDIIVTPGSKEAMFLLHLAFNGVILLPVSSWVSYLPQAKIALNKLHWIDTAREDNWFPNKGSINKVLKKIKNKNKLMILNSPNNPSGNLCKNFREIAEVAKKNKMIILSDEIYTELSFDNNYESISQFYPEGTIISSGLSKWCGAGGWRLGFLAFPKQLKELKDKIVVLGSETYSAVNTPTQLAAIDAYSNDYDEYKTKTKKILKAVGEYVYNKLKSNRVNINKPEGGFYLMPEFLSKKFKSSIKMCNKILDETGVALLPGTEFGFKESKLIFRLSFTDFDGDKFLSQASNDNNINEIDIEQYAPNVVSGAKLLADWFKKN